MASFSLILQKGNWYSMSILKKDFYAFWVVEDIFNTTFLSNVSSFERSVSRPLEFLEILLKVDCDSTDVLKKAGGSTYVLWKSKSKVF